MTTSSYSVYQLKQQEEELCQTLTLDYYVSNKQLLLPDIIKIDDEGAEIYCLLGGKKSLDGAFHSWSLNFMTKSCLKKGYSILKSMGYALFTKSGLEIDRHYLLNKNHFHSSVLCLPSNSSKEIK